MLWKIIFSAVIPLVLLTPSLYSSELPLEKLESSISKVQSILHDPKLAGEEKKAERRAKLRAVFIECFDFKEMSRRSLGSNINILKNRLDEFVEVFVDFLERSYLDKIELEKDIKISYQKAVVDGDSAEIRTKVKLKSGEEYKVDYRMRLKDGWKVYDISIEDISLVNNYRSQFARILSSGGGVEELFYKLRTSIERLDTRDRERAGRD